MSILFLFFLSSISKLNERLEKKMQKTPNILLQLNELPPSFTMFSMLVQQMKKWKQQSVINAGKELVESIPRRRRRKPICHNVYDQQLK